MDAEAKEKVATHLDELAGWLKDSVQGTGTFVKEQAPEVAREIVMWEIGSSAVMIGLTLFVAIITQPLQRRWWQIHERTKAEKQSNNCGNCPYCALSIAVRVFGWGFSFLVFAYNLHHLVFALCAPRLVVIEYIRHLVR